MSSNYDALDIPPIVADAELRAKVGKLGSKYKKDAERQSKPSSCLLCGKELGGFCNSHTLPQFCLQEIAVKGQVITIGAAIGTNLVSGRVGLNSAGTFHLICEKCDNEFFKEYESPLSYDNRPSQRMLGKIAVKCCLMELAKSRRDHVMYNNLAGDYLDAHLAATAYARGLSAHDDEGNLSVALSAACAGNRAYKVLCFEKLDYVTPVAFQTMVTPMSDLEGNLINNLFNPNSAYSVEPLYCCCFPMKGNTIVIVFHHRRTSRFNAFDGQMAALSRDERLLAILKVVLAYSEDAFFSPSIEETVSGDKGLAALCRMNVDSLAIRPSAPNAQIALLDIKEAASAKYSLDMMPVIPNLLGCDYALIRP